MWVKTRGQPLVQGTPVSAMRSIFRFNSDTFTKQYCRAKFKSHFRIFSSIDDVKVTILRIYSKDECPLCDGLQNKLEAIIDRAQFTGGTLGQVQLEVRKINERKEWESKYSMQVPVLSVINGNEERIVPRSSPRITADKLERHIVDFLF